MGVIGGDPVLWVNVKTLVDEGAWSEPHMAAWDQALTAAAARYPNLKDLRLGGRRPERVIPGRAHPLHLRRLRPAGAADADALAAAYPG